MWHRLFWYKFVNILDTHTRKILHITDRRNIFLWKAGEYGLDNKMLDTKT